MNKFFLTFELRGVNESLILAEPFNITILDDRGREVKSMLGPFPENAQLSLKCQVMGGNVRLLTTLFYNFKFKTLLFPFH